MHVLCIHDSPNDNGIFHVHGNNLSVSRTVSSYLVEVRASLDLAGSLVPLEILREVIRDGVLGAPVKQTLRLRKGIRENNPCLVRETLKFNIRS